MNITKMSRAHQFIFLIKCCIFLSCVQIPRVRTAIHTRSANIVANSLIGDIVDNSIVTDNVATSAAAAAATATLSTSQHVNTDLMDKMSWKCANNASCLYALANSLLQSYKRGETVRIGIIDLVKLPPTKSKMKSKLNASESGRGMSTFVDFISGNAIRIPIGPMVFSVQRAEDDGDYIEVALLKKAVSQGRRNDGDGRGEGLLGGSGIGGTGSGGSGGGGGGGGLLSGGGNSGNGHSGIGGGGGGGLRGIRHRKKEDKKQFQMFIPMYLAATTFGWTLLAAKAVGLLTLKALAISKLAFVVAAGVIIKKMMDSASAEKMLYQYPEHTPYMMPYGMDYPMHSMGGSELGTGEMYHPALHLAAAGPMQHHGHPGFEGLTAESSLHHNIADVQNNTQVLAALNAAGLGQKVKREDSWLAKTSLLPLLHSLKRKPFTHKVPPDLNNFLAAQKFRNGQAFALAAAAAVAENDAEMDEDQMEKDDIFNEEENIRDAMEFLGMKLRKKRKL